MANIFRAKSLISRTGTFSHEVIAPNIVYNTGDQSIDGVKDFNNQINVSGIKFDVLTTAQVPVHQEGLLYYSDDEKTLNLDVDITDLKLLLGQETWLRAKNGTAENFAAGTIVYITGAQGNTPLVRKSIATSDAGSARTIGVAAHTINSNAKGYFTTFGLVQGVNTSAYPVGTTLYLSWQTSGGFTGVKPQAPNHMVRIGDVIDQGNEGSIFVTIQNGFELEELHDVNINGTNTLNNGDTIRYNSNSGLWFNESINTGIFQSQINSLSGAAVLTYGDQIITGTKYFYGQVYTNNLYVTGTEFITNVQNNFVQSPYIILNLTGGALDGGMFFVTGTGLTGVNDSGPIIGFDHSNKFKFGISTRNSDLSTLNDIAAFQDITAYSGFVDNKYATIINLASTGNTLASNLANTGSTLQTQINNLGNTYATVNNLALTGSTLQTNINNLSGYINSSNSNIVFTTGNQTISGDKTFINNQTFSGNIGVSGTGIFNALDLNNIDQLTLSGIDISITGSTVNVFGNILISGNPVLTGIPDASWASQSEIDSLSGNAVFLTGNQIINGLKTFTSGIDIYSGTSPQSIRVFNVTGTNSGEFGLLGWQNNNLIIGSQQSQSGTLRDVFLTGRNININASGVLNIIDPVNISGNLNVTGNILLSGTNILNYINSLSGSLNSTGINLVNTINSLSGSLNNTGINLFNRINSLSGYINSTSSNIVFSTGNQNIGGNKTFTGVTTFSGQEVNLVDTALNLSGVGDMTFSGTNINFINSPVYISGTNLRVSGEIYANGNIFISGNPVLTGIPDGSWASQTEINSLSGNVVFLTGNQTISGIKTFIGNHIISGNILVSGLLSTDQRPVVNGTGVLLSGEAAQVDLSSTIRTTGNQIISGVKDFQSIPEVSGKDIYYQKDVFYFTGNNFTPNNNLARTFEYILTGAAGASATLNAPINMGDGENIVIKIKQSPSGSNNMQFNAAYKFPGSVVPSLTLLAGKADIYTVLKVGTGFYSTYVKDFID